MKKKIEIDGKPCELQSSAATPIIFKQVFHRDLLISFFGLDKKEDDAVIASDGVEAIQQLAFIMNMQATKKFSDIIGKLTVEEYYEWLDQFDYDTFQRREVINEILSTWNKNINITSEEKNLNGPQ